MAQAGLHCMAGAAVRRWVPGKRWLMLGIVLGSLLPDADNFGVAFATLTGASTEGIHRTFTHTVFTVLFIVLVFVLVARVNKKGEWANLGVGLGTGVLMHIVLDLLVWFNGVEILWPLPSWINLWQNVSPPDWWMDFMMPAEFLAFTLFLLMLAAVARRRGTDQGYLKALRIWTIVQAVLFLLFTLLLIVMESGYLTVYGAVYLLSLSMAAGVTLGMRNTVEAI